MVDSGRVGAADQALVASDGAATHLHPPGFDPSRVEALRNLASECEEADAGDQQQLLQGAYKLIFGGPECIPIGTWPGYSSPRWDRFHAMLATQAFECAAKLLGDRRALWAMGSMEDGPFARLCWPMPNGTFGGGYVEGQAETVALSMCAAALRGHAIAMEARQGTDPKGLDGEAATARAEGIAQRKGS